MTRPLRFVAMMVVATGCVAPEPLARTKADEIAPKSQAVVPSAVRDADAVDCSHPGVLLAAVRRDRVAPATGTVRDLVPAVGTTVAEGARLFRVEARDLTDVAARTTARARTMKAAEAVARTRRVALQRRTRESGALQPWISASDVKTDREDALVAEAELRAATSERRAAELDRELADQRLGPLVVRAEAERRVAALYVENGAHVVAGQPVLRVLSTSPVELHFAVPEADACRLTEGSLVRWRFADASEAGEARVTVISPEIDARSGLVFVEAQLEHTDRIDERSGASVDVFAEGCAPPPADAVDNPGRHAVPG